AAAPVTACDVVVHGILDGVPRGWVRLPSGTFRGDRAADPEVSDGDLRAQAQLPGQERTWTCVPPGSGVRLGIDRDEDGCLAADGPEPDDPGTGCGKWPADSDARDPVALPAGDRRLLAAKPARPQDRQPDRSARDPHCARSREVLEVGL